MVRTSLKLTTAAFAFAALVPGAYAHDTLTWRFGTVVQESHCIYTTIKTQIAEEIARRTNGHIAIEVFPAGQLGGEREMLQGVQTGAIEAVASSEGIIGSFIPEWRFINLPFLIESKDDWDKINALPSVQALYKKSEDIGYYMFPLGYMGARILNLRDGTIDSPDDFKGMRIRTQENPIQIATVEALGGQAEAIPLPELYSALQTRVVDAMYNDPSIFTTFKTYEVAPYVTNLPLFASMGAINASKQAIDALSPEEQEIVKDVFYKGSIALADCALDAAGKAVEQLKSGDMLKGYNVIEDVAPFRALVEPTYEKFLDGNAEAAGILREILAAK
jgi:tripartite ATP-independent transporter DctP family solute receptor